MQTEAAIFLCYTTDVVCLYSIEFVDYQDETYDLKNIAVPLSVSVHTWAREKLPALLVVAQFQLFHQVDLGKKI